MSLPKPYCESFKPSIWYTDRRVRVYRNLHKKCFSVVDTWSNSVVAHTDKIQLKEVQFRVQPAGRQKVLDTGRKNVHAYAVGYVTEFDDVLTDPVRYDPYRFSQFHRFLTHTEAPIFTATRCSLDNGKIFV